jgi:hypothetical protein
MCTQHFPNINTKAYPFAIKRKKVLPAPKDWYDQVGLVDCQREKFIIFKRGQFSG